MNTKTNIAAVAAILTVLAAPSVASAQAMFLPDSYTWNQIGTANVPADAHASVASTHQRRAHSALRYIPGDARGSVVLYGATEGGAYTPDAPTAPHGRNRDFQDGSRG
jgi:hypothetical protein